LSFEPDVDEDAGSQTREVDERISTGYDDWLLERKVRIPRDDVYNEGEMGDSCCFGTRTVDIGRDCVWKLHGGV
jgi:hypothetical protein